MVCRLVTPEEQHFEKPGFVMPERLLAVVAQAERAWTRVSQERESLARWKRRQETVKVIGMIFAGQGTSAEGQIEVVVRRRLGSDAISCFDDDASGVADPV
jgi:hypothetical protein